MIQEVGQQNEVRISIANDIWLVGSLYESIKNGEYYYVFPDGTKQYAGLYVNDQKQGIWQDYKGDQLFPSIYENGIRNPFLGIIDQQGNKQGFWTEIEGDDDQLIYQGDYKDNIRVGAWNVYLNGELVGKGSYNEHGIKVGEWIEVGGKLFNKNQSSSFFNNYCLTYLGEYKNGKKKGYWTINYKGEQIGGGNYNEDEMKEGDWTEIYMNFEMLNGLTFDDKIIKQKGAYRNGLHIGEWKITCCNNVIGGGNYIEQGLKHGKWTEFLIPKKNRGQKIFFQGEYNHGIRVGEWKIKLNNDYAIFNYDQQGRKQGYWIEAYKNQTDVKYAGMYNNDLRIGGWNILYRKKKIGGGIYDQNGLKQDEWIEINNFNNLENLYYGRYKNGIRIGEWQLKFRDEIIGGGNYDEQGVKQDLWVENNYEEMIFQLGRYKIEQGRYKNGIRQRMWVIEIREKNLHQYTTQIFRCCYDQKGRKQGKWTELSKNFSNDYFFIEFGTYRNGIRTGKWQANDQEYVLMNGEYDQNGVKQGLWQDLNYFFVRGSFNMYNNALVSSFGQYTNGLRVGEWEIINQNVIIGNCNFDERGVLNGEVKYDIQSETLQFSYESGFLKQAQINKKLALNLKIEGCFNSRNLKDGQWMEIFNGIQFSGQYNDGKKKDFWIITDMGKKIGFGNYDQNNLKQGYWIEPYNFYSNSNKIIAHRYYKDDILVGNCKIMSDGCEIGEGNYDSNGNKQGIWKEIHYFYNNSRQIIFQGEYKDNVRVGEWIILFKKRKIGDGTYNEIGLKQGQWHEVDTTFNNWRKKFRKGEYKNGQQIGEWVQEQNGVIIRRYQFDDEGNIVYE